MKIKEKIYSLQLSKIREVDDDLFSTDFSQNMNYGIIPLNVLNDIMLFQRLPDLLSMSLSCSLFYKTQNSSYFWKTYHCNFFKTDNIEESKKYKEECVNWKREFVKQYFDFVYIWGCGVEGGLGHGNTENEYIPKLLEKIEPHRIKNVFCGHCCCSVVLSNGDLLSWGSNYARRLGHEEDDHEILSPECLVKLPENRKIIQVAHGEGTSFFLDDFGDIWGCGSDRYGFLTGKKSRYNIHQPIKIKISESPKIIKIVSGLDHFGCICSSGNLYTWGSGRYGKLGHGKTTISRVPQIVKYFENIGVKDVSMGISHTLLTTEDGKIYSFGGGEYGQLGNGKSSNSSPELIKYFYDNNIVITKTSCGYSRFSGCLDSVGNCYMWGNGSEGQIGNGSFTKTNSSPIRILSFIDSSGKKIDLDIPNRHKFIQLECGHSHSIALLEESAIERKTFVLTWGSGKFGELGLGTENNVNIPTVVPFFENKFVKSVHSVGDMSVAIL